MELAQSPSRQALTLSEVENKCWGCNKKMKSDGQSRTAVPASSWELSAEMLQGLGGGAREEGKRTVQTG